MLDSFGKPDKNILHSYKYVLYKRSTDMVGYMKKRYEQKTAEKNNRSCMSKCGSLIKTLFVWGVVASTAIPALIEIYHKLMDDGQSMMDKEYETVNMRDEDIKPSSPEDIARRAQEAEAQRDAEFAAKMKATEEEIERMEQANAQKSEQTEEL